MGTMKQVRQATASSIKAINILGADMALLRTLAGGHEPANETGDHSLKTITSRIGATANISDKARKTARSGR